MSTTAERTIGNPRSGAAARGDSQRRLVSLDAFRGITIAGMLLVNNPGSWSHIYAPLRHAEWHGWTPTDLIFPFFLFIVGVAMTLSFAKLRERGVSRRSILAKAAKRAAILFALGLLLHGFPGYDLSTIRIPGVLQRIALASLAASVIVIFLGARGRLIALIALLFGYWALQTLTSIPGAGPSVLEPGRDLGAYIDRAVFTEAHLWSQSKTWDPEGLLSTLPAIGTVLCGVFVGSLLYATTITPQRKAGTLIATGIGSIVAGLIWNLWFPINKNLWTSSYVVFTAGLACIVLAACYWIVDVRGRSRLLLPFTIYGMNAIAAFVLSGLFARLLSLVRVDDGVTLKTHIYNNYFLSWASPINASLAYAVGFVVLWLGIMWVLYWRRVFIKV
jgi:predicted acyltransferase